MVLYRGSVLAHKHAVVQYQLGGQVVEARIPPSLVHTWTLPLFASNQAVADYGFTLERYLCEPGELNFRTLIARIGDGLGAHTFQDSPYIKLGGGFWLGCIDKTKHRIWVLASQESVEEAYISVLGHFLRYIVPKSKGGFFHCAGIHIAGQTLLFLARSGTGKTTLARLFIQDRQAVYFDLESQPDLRRLQNPELALSSLAGIVVMDEIQVMPSLFARSFITCTTSPTSSGSSALVGSSKSSTDGFMASARAIATRCFCPPESVDG